MPRLFSQARVAASAHGVLDGLPGEERRKTGWMRAEAAGDAGPWRQQAIPGRGRRDADALRDHAIEHLGTDGAVPVVDEPRSRHGRHRHVWLVMPAFAMPAAIRTRANPTPQ